MKVEIERGSEEFQFWQDVFAYRKKYHIITERDADNAVDEAGIMYEKYKNTTFEHMVKQILLDVIDQGDLEGRSYAK